mmetsp:Transcript_9877/g.27631  ORF Transcript_9877/g.27631 Transcript_9877/m.27631 type:complete len:259 (-) Transcript_9877:46-822(-)
MRLPRPRGDCAAGHHCKWQARPHPPPSPQGSGSQLRSPGSAPRPQLGRAGTDATECRPCLLPRAALFRPDLELEACGDISADVASDAAAAAACHVWNSCTSGAPPPASATAVGERPPRPASATAAAAAASRNLGVDGKPGLAAPSSSGEEGSGTPASSCSHPRGGTQQALPRGCSGVKVTEGPTNSVSLKLPPLQLALASDELRDHDRGTLAPLPGCQGKRRCTGPVLVLSVPGELWPLFSGIGLAWGGASLGGVPIS